MDRYADFCNFTGISSEKFRIPFYIEITENKYTWTMQIHSCFDEDKFLVFVIIEICIASTFLKELKMKGLKRTV